jgi:hypothetical protein
MALIKPARVSFHYERGFEELSINIKIYSSSEMIANTRARHENSCYINSDMLVRV